MTSNKTDSTNVDQDYNDGPKMDIEGPDYDGIKELDNPPPGWIMAVFYLTIGIAILYGAYYFWLHVGNPQDAEYAKSVEEAKQKYKSEQSGVAFTQLSDPTSLAAGRDIFTAMNCITCHGQNGNGNAIGPNLTDNFWLHGCKFDDVFNTIKNGYPVKGMTAFVGQLTEDKIQQVASFVLSLKGSNPDNAKAPQGVPCE